ncbi:MAG: hypothetical protein WBL61_18845 [Bryobacteraceae bacterium]
MRLIPLAAAFWMAAAASAQDARLNALHATLVTLHSHAKEADIENLGGRPELTIAKHQLRDWIETQLASLKNDGDVKAFAERINQSLKPVGVAGSADDQNLLGSLGEVRINREEGMLIVTAAVGILCQNDESAYGYKLVDGRWRRVWESEQNDYVPNKYNPQQIIAVHVLQSYKDGHEDGPPFVLTLGNHWGCASAWHPVYYRVWRIDPSGAKLLIDDSAMAWLRVYTYAVGSITQSRKIESAPVDVLIEYTEASIDAMVHNREAIRYYLIDGDHVRRVDPVALSPRDFVDEWLTRGWNESAAWSASPTLQQWHRRLHGDWVGGQFGDTMHCQTPDLWQVTFEPHDAEKNFAPEPKVYFLVRWRPPYRFTMADISDKPWSRCTEEDPDADEWRTLFNTQEWRW